MSDDGKKEICGKFIEELANNTTIKYRVITHGTQLTGKTTIDKFDELTQIVTSSNQKKLVNCRQSDMRPGLECLSKVNRTFEAITADVNSGTVIDV